MPWKGVTVSEQRQRIFEEDRTLGVCFARDAARFAILVV